MSYMSALTRRGTASALHDDVCWRCAWVMLSLERGSSSKLQRLDACTVRTTGQQEWSEPCEEGSRDVPGSAQRLVKKAVSGRLSSEWQTLAEQGKVGCYFGHVHDPPLRQRTGQLVRSLTLAPTEDARLRDDRLGFRTAAVKRAVASAGLPYVIAARELPSVVGRFG